MKDEKAEERSKSEPVDSIEHITKEADEMEKVMEEELKGLSGELKKKEDKEEKDKPKPESAKEEVK